MQRVDSLGKTLMLGKIKAGGEGVSEDEKAGRRHQGDGHELGQTPGDAQGQRCLAGCSPWGLKESDMTGQLN